MFPGHWTRLRACYESNNDVIGLRKRGRRNRPRLAREYEKETERDGGRERRRNGSLRRERRSGGIGRRFVSFFLGNSMVSRISVSRSSITTFVARSVYSDDRRISIARVGVSLVKSSAEEKYRVRFDRTDGRGLIEMYGTVSEIRSYASSPRA